MDSKEDIEYLKNEYNLSEMLILDLEYLVAFKSGTHQHDSRMVSRRLASRYHSVLMMMTEVFMDIFGFNLAVGINSLSNISPSEEKVDYKTIAAKIEDLQPIVNSELKKYQKKMEYTDDDMVALRDYYI